jgi:tol-pal system protein YbgF
MQSITQRFAAMASLGLAIVVSAPAAAQVSAPNEQIMNLVVQVQQLQDEIRMLRGQLDEQTFELENLKRRQRDQYLDLDQRISELSSGLPAGTTGAVASVPGQTRPAPAATPPQSGTTVASTSGPAVGPTSAAEPPADPGPDVTQRADTPSAVTALAVPEVATATTAATPEAQQAAYDEAFQALKELRYADAAQGFQDFLVQYPGSSLAGNAQYWLGESYYVTRNYEIALQAFQDLLDGYPDSTKRGDGLLKIGFTHYELEQYDQARAALEQVQRDYPNSPLSRLADSRLRSMRLEGQF